MDKTSRENKRPMPLDSKMPSHEDMLLLDVPHAESQRTPDMLHFLGPALPSMDYLLCKPKILPIKSSALLKMEKQASEQQTQKV